MDDCCRAICKVPAAARKVIVTCPWCFTRWTWGGAAWTAETYAQRVSRDA